MSARHGELPLVAGIYDAHFGQLVPGGNKNKELPIEANPSTNDKNANEALKNGDLNQKNDDPFFNFNSEFLTKTSGHVELIFTQADAPARSYLPAAGTYAPEPLPGYAAEALLTYEESTCYLLLALVEQALTDGFELADVAVLCRTRWQSKIVAKFLKERGFPIISADSLALEFAEVVNLLVSIFRVLHQPADTLARAEALLLFDKVVRGLAPTPARARHVAEVANKKDAASFFDDLRALGYDVQEAETGNLGLYELAERLIGLFGLLGRNGESEYLFRFLDLTMEYSLRHGNNLGQFLTEWEQRKGRISINAPGGAGGHHHHYRPQSQGLGLRCGDCAVC